MAVFNKVGFLVVGMMLFVSLRAAIMPLESCRSAAAQGDLEALYQMGQRYEKGLEVRKDKFKALSNYRKAAEKGHRRACERLAELYETGTFVGKDLSMAARYRALASGQSGKDVEKAASAAKERAKVSQSSKIDAALDYILGRNGRERDPKAGIVLLYTIAKDDPVAQNAFVDVWCTGNLDDGLSKLSDGDWKLIMPWFHAGYKAGKKPCGWLLGLEAYENRQYQQAENYWIAAGSAGLPQAWVRIAKLHMTGLSLENQGGPKSMWSDIRAKSSLEKALRLNPRHQGALFNMALVCLYGTPDSVLDYRRARDILKLFYDEDPQNKWYVWGYGYAGFMYVCAGPWKEIQKIRHDAETMSYAPSVRAQKLQRYNQLREECLRVARTWIPLIRQAANAGVESAQQFLKDLGE